MANTEDKKLAIDVLARVDKLEKAMTKAAKITAQRTGQMERSVKTMRDRMEKSFAGIGSNALSGFAKGIAAPLAAMLTLRAAISGAADAMSKFDAIGKAAKAGGLDAESFQELEYAMQLGGISTDQFAKAMETFAKNTGLAAAGKGRLITQLKALNPELLTNLQTVTDQEERLRLVADALDNEADASRKAAIASALFGEAGVRMVEALKGGSAALDDTAKKARELGLVVDNELIAKSEKLNDEWATAARVIDTQFKEALIQLAPVMISSAQLAANVATAINDIVQSMRGLQDKQTEILREEYGRVSAALESGGDPRSRRSLQARKTALEAELRKRAVDDLRDQLLRLNAPAADTVATTSTGGSTTTRNDAAAAAIKQAEAVRDLIGDLQFEQQQLGRNAQEQELYNLLKMAGVTAESEFGQQIAATLGSLQEQRATIQANAEAMRLFSDTAKSAMRTFIDDLIEGRDAGKALGNVLANLGNRLIDIGLGAPMGGPFRMEFAA